MQCGSPRIGKFTYCNASRRTLALVPISRSENARIPPRVLPPKTRTLSLPDLLDLHGEPERADPFRWLHAGHRDPRVLRYLQHENENCKVQLRHLLPLRKQLEQEVAELSWRQAVIMAAHQPLAEFSHSSSYYGHFEYRRELAGGVSSRIRHLRVPRSDAADAVQHQQHQQTLEATRGASGSVADAAMQPVSTFDLTCSEGTEDCRQTVLDEEQRAGACPSPAAHAVYSFAPSPNFDLAAFTETTEPLPAGKRLPDRFALHVVDVPNGAPAFEPLQGVSGDVGWVSLGSRSTGSYGGGRLYFTRAAQRELWCLDVAPPATVAGGVGSASTHIPPGLTDAISPRLVFRDPDGQPIQLVQYGSYLYAETLGNSGVPLEIRLLGAACAVNPFCSSGGSMQPAIGTYAPSSELIRQLLATEAGMPLVPRQAGRECSAFCLEAAEGRGPKARDARPDTSDSGTYDCSDCGGSSRRLPQGALLLWLRDVGDPNGRLLLALAMLLHAPSDAVTASKEDRAGACAGEPQVLTLELMPHDPAFRIVHVEARGVDRVLCVRVAIDVRGDPLCRYNLQELQIDWGAVRQAVAEVAESGRAPVASNRIVPVPAAAEPVVRHAWTALGLTGVDSRVDRDGSGNDCSGGSGVAAGADPSGRCSRLAVTQRHRAISVSGALAHTLRVLAWSNDAEVTLSYSSMASKPAVSTIQLLPYSASPPPEIDGCAPPAVVVAGETAEDVELRCEGDDPRVVMERLWATSYDGTQVPITLCRLRETGEDAGDGVISCGGGIRGPSQPAPLLLRVYGAYGKDPPLDYQPALQPLLQRGVAVAIAHVRGGGHLGPTWYEGGRGTHKANSYRDLLAAATHLVSTGVTAPGLLCLDAESAGGWAAGPALNAAGAALFRAAVLTVPTLDALTSLLEDESYAPYELGDPRADAALYREVLEWSPYDGLCCGHPYPMLLLRIGLYDTNVPYWDPAKYMARLRSLAACGAGFGLRVMQVRPGGHDSYDTVADDAAYCAFVLWAVGAWTTSELDTPAGTRLA